MGADTNFEKVSVHYKAIVSEADAERILLQSPNASLSQSGKDLAAIGAARPPNLHFRWYNPFRYERRCKNLESMGISTLQPFLF